MPQSTPDAGVEGPTGGPEEPAGWPYADPDPSNVGWTTTALLRPEGTWSFRTTNVALWELAYALKPYVELGLAVHTMDLGLGIALPMILMNVGVAPTARFAAQLADGVSAGLSTQLGFWFTSASPDRIILVWNATPALTIGSPDLFLNVAVGIWGLTSFWLEGRASHPYTLATFLPSVGGNWRVSRRTKIHAELVAPAVVFEGGRSAFPYGTAWALSYGVGVFGESIWGDIGFLLPLWEDIWDVLQYLPCGLPLFRFGVRL